MDINTLRKIIQLKKMILECDKLGINLYTDSYTMQAYVIANPNLLGFKFVLYEQRPIIFYDTLTLSDYYELAFEIIFPLVKNALIAYNEYIKSPKTIRRLIATCMIV